MGIRAPKKQYRNKLHWAQNGRQMFRKVRLCKFLMISFVTLGNILVIHSVYLFNEGILTRQLSNKIPCAFQTEQRTIVELRRVKQEWHIKLYHCIKLNRLKVYLHRIWSWMELPVTTTQFVECVEKARGLQFSINWRKIHWNLKNPPH